MSLQKFEKISNNFILFLKALIFSKYHITLLIIFYIEIGISIYFYTIKSKILSYIFFFLGIINYILVIFFDDRYDRIYTLNNSLKNVYNTIPSIIVIFDSDKNIYFANDALQQFLKKKNYNYEDVINIFKDSQKNVYNLLKGIDFNKSDIIFHSLKITEDKFLKIYFGNLNNRSMKFLFMLETYNSDVNFETFINSFMENIIVNTSNNIIIHDSLKNLLKNIKLEENKLLDLIKEKNNFYLEIIKNNYKHLLQIKQISNISKKKIKIYKIIHGKNLLTPFEDVKNFLGVVIINHQFNIIECNNTFHNMIEIYFIKKHNIMSYLEVDSQNTLKEFLTKPSKNSINITLLEHPDKTYKVYSKTIENYGWYLFILDNQYEQELENKILHMQKISLLGQMLASVSHDFNNILMAINGFCDVLLLNIPQVDNKYFSIMQIKYNVNRAINLVNTILCTSKKNNNKEDNKETNVYETIRELLISIDTLIENKITISFNNKCKNSIIIAKISSIYMEQILLNILLNARDAMKETGGNIHISLDYIYFTQEISHHNFNNYFAEIIISDEGTGIESENLEKIFDSFFTTKSDKGGTGLGLSIVQTLIKKYKGFIKINSEINKGTIFKIYIPSYEIPISNNLEINDLNNKKVKIMILEDDPSIRCLIQNSLENLEDTKIMAFCSNKEVKNFIKNNDTNVQIFISDVMITEGDSTETVNKILNINEDCYLVLMSGYSLDYLRENLPYFEKIENYKNFVFIHKPFQMTELIDLIKKYIKIIKNK
ncbi:hypothetical protein AB836_02120 [Rickettsiales bacterium (ex Bugula neritina AB1)]|nr:hypothetical protein AB836_02120 [Rickettsiales bacterium (ex Bugula neritina AB1)]